MIEIINPITERKKLKAAVFDFDGTLSTLRCGWEKVMKPLMIEQIGAGKLGEAELDDLVDKYIDESTGIQTVHQMIWLRDKVIEYGLNPERLDEWGYKDEYNHRLIIYIENRLKAVENGANPENYSIAGAKGFLAALKQKGVSLYLASGTDLCDVLEEAALLNLTRYFDKNIFGAVDGRLDCSKETVINEILNEKLTDGGYLLGFGDGYVEIELIKKAGGYAVGVASDEKRRFHIDQKKRRRLVAAGADAIIPDFSGSEALINFLNI